MPGFLFAQATRMLAHQALMFFSNATLKKRLPAP